jgi:AcrR family transcriptional regulator
MRYDSGKLIIQGYKMKSLTPKGKATRAMILDTAHEVFKEMGYYNSSVSEITRRCNISMGTFYLYFKNKEQVFLELNDLIISRFIDKINSLSLNKLNFEKRINAIIKLLYEHIKSNFAFNRILGESELIDSVTISYYDSITRYYRNFFRNEAQNGNIKLIDPDIISYGLIGICYFNSLKWNNVDFHSSDEELLKLISELILFGINGSKIWKKPSNKNITSLPEPLPLKEEKIENTTKGSKTREAILRAAEEVIGKYGINRASISEITRLAGVAQGTFYIYFKSKNELLEGLVKFINKEMRKELQRYAKKTSDRRDAERVGIITFFNFLSHHKKIYKIIPECEMISKDVAQWYYEKIAEGYIKGLSKGIRKKEIKNFPVKFLARSIMGLIHFVALKRIIWTSHSNKEPNEQFLKDVIEFVLFGIKS